MADSFLTYSRLGSVSQLTTAHHLHRLERHKTAVLKVDQKWLTVDQFLGDFTRHGQHCQTTILEFTDLHPFKFFGILGPPANGFDFGVHSGSGTCLKKAEELETTDECKSQINELRVALKDIKSPSTGSQIIRAPVSALSKLLRDDKAEECHLGKAS